MVLATRTSLGKSETSSDKSRTNFKVICTRVFNVHRVFKRVISLWDLLSVEKENQHVQNKFWRKKKRRKKRKDENTTKKKSKEKKNIKEEEGKKLAGSTTSYNILCYCYFILKHKHFIIFRMWCVQSSIE